MQVQITECPRDAMQGLIEFIPTPIKIKYLNALLKCGFSSLDFGSFVSPKAIPQMRDTIEVLESLESGHPTKLLAIVANFKGAEQAIQFDKIDYLGYPFSVSNEFQLRNTNATIDESWSRLGEIQNLCLKNNKSLVVYLSMGFGNPYGETWHPDLVNKFSEKLFADFSIKYQALSDTIGCATPQVVNEVFSSVISSNNLIEYSAHLHVKPENAISVLSAAFNAGCRKFEGALKGYGGCPMAKDELTGNMPTEIMINWFNQNNIQTSVSTEYLNESLILSNQVFSNN
jgi:hydroxymethylglutaryl-CoA lyase